MIRNWNTDETDAADQRRLSVLIRRIHFIRVPFISLPYFAENR